MNAKSRFALPCLLLVLAGFGCGRPAPAPQPIPTVPTQTTVSFGTAVSLRIGAMVRFEDGLAVKLAAIEDSRCKPDVQCVWEGELAPVLSVSGGGIAAAQEIRLGTSRTPQATVNGYAFLLRSATETSATIVVSRSVPTAPIPEDMIRVATPQPNQTVKSPLVVSGEARGTWYFEASFPVKLLDANGNILAQAPAQAQGEWMTAEFVPFSVTLTFPNPTTATGTLVLEKDNPSGLPEYDDSRSIPIRFSP
jgi:hypothetical protein